MALIFKIAGAAEWRQAEAAGVFEGAGRRSRRRLHPFLDRRAGRRDGREMVRRPRRPCSRRRRRRCAGRGSALGVLARRRAVSASLRDTAAIGRAVVAPVAARPGRPPHFREPRAVMRSARRARLASVAETGARDRASRRDRRVASGARRRARARSAAQRRSVWHDLSQSAWACGRVRQERRGRAWACWPPASVSSRSER